VLALVNISNQVVNRYRYDPWGAPELKSETKPNPFQAMGRHFEPHGGLYQVRARWYDPHLGRFLSQDPIGLAGGINPYAYANNSPTNLRNPSGLCSSASQLTRSVEEGFTFTCRRWGFSTPREQGWSNNFGNRGNGVFGGVDGPSLSSPAGGGRPGIAPSMAAPTATVGPQPSCGAALVNFGINIGLELPALKAGGLAVRSASHFAVARAASPEVAT
jgi:RHS repeat-associated protein